MLKDLALILDQNDSQNLHESDFQAAASLMLQKQFIWSDGYGQKKYFDLAIRFQDYFEQLFDALGFNFVRDYKYGFCGVIPRNGLPIMTKLDTILLLLLAKVHDEQCRKACTEKGRSTPCLVLLLDLYEQLTEQEKPSRPDVLSSLKRLARFGIVQVGDVDEQTHLPRITVLPAISYVVTSEFLSNIDAFISDTETSLAHEVVDESQTETDEKDLSEV